MNTGYFGLLTPALINGSPMRLRKDRDERAGSQNLILYTKKIKRDLTRRGRFYRRLTGTQLSSPRPNWKNKKRERESKIRKKGISERLTLCLYTSTNTKFFWKVPVSDELDPPENNPEKKE